MVAEEATEEIREMLWDLLSERFGDEFEFGPIVVRPRVDQDGDEYLHSYIVFKGDQKKLDPKRTLRLSGRLWPRAEELGYPGIPTQSFVEKSECASVEEESGVNRDHLLAIAESLASGSVGSQRGRPRQADLRRAISTAYYALFHTLAGNCANLLVGGRASTRTRQAWRQLYRALDHGQVKRRMH